jgi:hypothetical protein
MVNSEFDRGDTRPLRQQQAVQPADEDQLPGTGELNPDALADHTRASQEDRQRLMRDLSGTGALRRNTRVDQAPLTIKQFLRGEIDLDTELARRFARAPLMATIARTPQDARPAGRATAMLASQSNDAALSVDVYGDQNVTELTFTLGHMLAFRFRLENLSTYDKRRWLDLMRRDSGVAFLWSSRRWEDEYAICVLRPNYVRVYAFSPRQFEASVRITHPVARQLTNWLDMRWFQADHAGG